MNYLKQHHECDLNKIKFALPAILFLLFIISSCSSGGEDGPMNPPPNNDVTYTGEIKAIIDGRCLACHTDPPVNNAPMSLVTRADVQNAIQSRGLIGRVENGSMPPQGADLTAAQVQALKDWQANGFAN